MIALLFIVVYILIGMIIYPFVARNLMRHFTKKYSTYTAREDAQFFAIAIVLLWPVGIPALLLFKFGLWIQPFIEDSHKDHPNSSQPKRGSSSWWRK